MALMKRFALILLVFTFSLQQGVNAQSCQDDPTYEQLDFWIGSWEVFYTRTGEMAGTNVIEKILDGCAYFEQWIGEDGYSGTSLTFIDPFSITWSQQWVDNATGSQFYWNGSFENNILTFDYEAEDMNDIPVDGRMMLIRLSASGIRQLNQVSPDGGENWQTLYDLTYIRVQ